MSILDGFLLWIGWHLAGFIVPVLIFLGFVGFICYVEHENEKRRKARKY